MPYVVTAPLVIAKNARGAFRHVYQGSPLPKETTAAHVQSLLDQGFIEEVGGDDATVQVAAVEPPRAGEGSTRDAWAAHAAALKVEHPEDATRADIIAAVDAAK